MMKPMLLAIFIVAMIAMIVSVDLIFFRGHFWARLAANVGIVLACIALYFRFLK